MQIKRIRYKDIERIPHLRVNKNFKTNFFGSTPAPFIGRYGYPHVNIGMLSPQFTGEMQEYDSPKLWNSQNYAIGQVASLRYGLVNSRMKANVKSLHGRFLEMVQEVGMAKKVAEVEVNLRKTPTLNFKPETQIKPFGPQGSVLKARITANTKVDTRVERIVSDTDLKAAEGLVSLYKKGFEESSLHKLLSVGNMGIGKKRKLVPTKWSITATDDTIGKQLITEIKQFNEGEYRAYFGGGWGNYYLVLFLPDVWSYELFEMYLGVQKNPWSKKGYYYSTDYENYAGRKNYADETAGGYYANRVSILEKMKELKRQHSCLVLRFITPEYNVPLGVWVCREATRKAMEKGIRFASEKLLMDYAQALIQKKFGFDIRILLGKSVLLKERKQPKLSQFF